MKEMNIQEPLLKALQEIGFEKPTEIQVKCIPLIREGKDVIGQSETGSGKTAAFGIPLLEKIEHGKGIQVLILAPTRELAEQIFRNLKSFSKYKKVFIAVIYGGVSMNPQIENSQKADIVIGTPGRLLDHLGRNTLKLDKIKYLVLDEADKMFEMGFIDDVRQILSHTPQHKQMLLFSATINKDVHGIAERYMHHPVKIKTKDYVEQKLLKQVYYNVRRNEKFSLLTHLIKHEKPKLAIVFCGTRHEVDFVARNLYKNGVEAMPLHGGLSQYKRTKTMEHFHNARIHVLVASDVAARGLDIKNVSHIFNYSIPKTSKEYVHRIGRTARMGEEGIAVNLLDERDYDNFNRVLSDHSLKIEQLPLPQFERIFVPKPEFRGGFHRGFRGEGQRRGFWEGHRRFGRSQGYGERQEEGRYGERRHSGSSGYGQHRGFHRGQSRSERRRG